MELQNFSSEISETISIRKEYYVHFPNKLNHPSTRSKIYWSILNSFYKGSKVPLIPLLLVNDKIVSDFTEKANLFNVFFSSHCTPISRNSVNRQKINKIKLNKDDILKIIRNLNVNKSYGPNDISIRMLKVCDSVVTESLSILFRNS